METLSIKIHYIENKKRELLRTCEVIAENTRGENGCNSCIILRDIGNGAISIEQQWEQQSFLNSYFRSNLFGALFGAMKLLSEHYEIIINNDTKEKGMQVVQAARAESRKENH